MNDARLEKYLSTLEHVLKPLPVSERAEIVTEMKSHVLSALERDPNASLDSVLSALGEPEIVANRYLLERGLKTTKPPISPIVKWIVIGFLVSFALALLFVVLLLFKFSPLVEINEKTNRISVLGGALQLNGDDHGASHWNFGGSDHQFKGSYSPNNEVKELSVQFGNGKFDIENSPTAEVTWDCHRGDRKDKDPKVQVSGDKAQFDLSEFAGVKCTIQVPSKMRFVLTGSNGAVQFDEPKFDLKNELANGKVGFKPATGEAYKFDVHVTNGRVDEFVSSTEEHAHAVVIHVTNGVINQ